MTDQHTFTRDEFRIKVGFLGQQSWEYFKMKRIGIDEYQDSVSELWDYFQSYGDKREREAEKEIIERLVKDFEFSNAHNELRGGKPDVVIDLSWLKEKLSSLDSKSSVK